MAAGAERFRIGTKPADERGDLLQIGRLPRAPNMSAASATITRPASRLARSIANSPSPSPSLKHPARPAVVRQRFMPREIAAQIGISAR